MKPLYTDMYKKAEIVFETNKGNFSNEILVELNCDIHDVYRIFKNKMIQDYSHEEGFFITIRKIELHEEGLPYLSFTF